MTFALLMLFVLAQPGECSDRSPGLSKCVEYHQETNGWSCKSVCYMKSKSKKDGGSDARPVDGGGTTKDACLADLQGQCRP